MCNGKEIGTASSITKCKELIEEDIKVRITEVINLVE